MSTNPDSSTPSYINQWDQRRIRNIMSATPFSSHSDVPVPPSRKIVGQADPVDVDAIVSFLLGLGTVVREHVEAARATEVRLRDLEADLAAVRRVFGSQP